MISTEARTPDMDIDIDSYSDMDFVYGHEKPGMDMYIDMKIVKVRS